MLFQVLHTLLMVAIGVLFPIVWVTGSIATGYVLSQVTKNSSQIYKALAWIIFIVVVVGLSRGCASIATELAAYGPDRKFAGLVFAITYLITFCFGGIYGLIKFSQIP